MLLLFLHNRTGSFSFNVTNDTETQTEQHAVYIGATILGVRLGHTRRVAE